MYWTGDQEYLAFGMGAVSLLNGLRFQRPKSLKRYYEFVNNGAREFAGNDLWSEGNLEFQNLEESLKTIFIGRLRTGWGIRTSVLKGCVCVLNELILGILRCLRWTLFFIVLLRKLKIC